MGRPGVHRGRHRDGRADDARRGRQRPRPARRRRRALQPQPVAGDGAARHLPVPRRRLVGRRRLPPRRRLGGARRRRSASRGRRTPRWRRSPGDWTTRTASTPSSPAGRRVGPRDDVVAAGRGCRRPGRSGDPPAGALRHRRRQPGWGLWPTVGHTKHGAQRVDGLPVHLSGTDWRLGRAGPVLGEDNERVLSEVLGLSAAEIGRLARRRGHLMAEQSSSERDRSDGVTVVELSHEHVAFAGKLLADMGADVTVVEPPGGSAQRTVRAVPRRRAGPGAQPLVVALQHVQARRRRRPGRRPATRSPASSTAPTCCSSAREHVRARPGGAGRRRSPRSIVVSITPFGLGSPRTDEPVTDLTLLAEGGPAWSCGYDDHTLPPVRGGGNQGFHAAGNWAVMAVLVALLSRAGDAAPASSSTSTCSPPAT